MAWSRSGTMRSSASWAVRATGRWGARCRARCRACAKTELPRAIADVLANRTPRTLTHVDAGIGRWRTDPAGQDPPGRRRRDAALARRHRADARRTRAQAERRAARARRRRRERRLVGMGSAEQGVLLLEPMEGDARPVRAAAASVVPRNGSTVSMPTTSRALKEALDAHLSGKTDHFQHEHRIRHEDGTYRRFLCRGVAVRGAGRRPVAHRRIADRHDRAGQSRRSGSAAPGSSIR